MNQSLHIPIIPNIKKYFTGLNVTVHLDEGEGEIDSRSFYEKQDDKKRVLFAKLFSKNIKIHSEAEIKKIVKGNRIINHQRHHSMVGKWTDILLDEFEQIENYDQYFPKGFVDKWCPELELINTEYDAHIGFTKIKAAQEAIWRAEDREEIELERQAKKEQDKFNTKLEYEKKTSNEVYDEAHRLNRHWKVILEVVPKDNDMTTLSDHFE
jgi:hypothetical protein